MALVTRVYAGFNIVEYPDELVTIQPWGVETSNTDNAEVNIMPWASVGSVIRHIEVNNSEE